MLMVRQGMLPQEVTWREFLIEHSPETWRAALGGGLSRPSEMTLEWPPRSASSRKVSPPEEAYFARIAAGDRPVVSPHADDRWFRAFRVKAFDPATGDWTRLKPDVPHRFPDPAHTEGFRLAVETVLYDRLAPPGQGQREPARHGLREPARQGLREPARQGLRVIPSILEDAQLMGMVSRLRLHADLLELVRLFRSGRGWREFGRLDTALAGAHQLRRLELVTVPLHDSLLAVLRDLPNLEELVLIDHPATADDVVLPGVTVITKSDRRSEQILHERMMASQVRARDEQSNGHIVHYDDEAELYIVTFGGRGGGIPGMRFSVRGLPGGRSGAQGRSPWACFLAFSGGWLLIGR